MKKTVEKIKDILNIKHITISPRMKDVLLGILVGFIIALLSTLGFFEKFEYITLDALFRLRGQRSANDNIVIVGIDDTSLELLGRWPWPREYHASFLQVLNIYRPRFVVFDILFPESDPKGDEAMAMVAKECKNLYLASYFTLDKDVKTVFAYPDFDLLPIPHLKYKVKGKEEFLNAKDVTLPVEPLMSAAKGVSIVNAPLDSDGSSRHVPLVIEFGGRLYPTLSLQLACDYLDVGIDSVIVKQDVVILPLREGDIYIPIDSSGRMVLNFSGPIDTFKQYSYLQLLHDYNRSLEEETKSILENLKEKIVFVGLAATGTVDSRKTPFSNLYPAVGIHATALSNILNRDSIRKSQPIFNVSTVLLVSAFLSLLLKRGRKAFINLSIMLMLFLFYAFLSFLWFVFLKFWIYTFAPLIAILSTYVAISISHYEAVRYEKKMMENELLIARRIQQSFLPKSYPKVSFLEFAATCSPAKHVGGDLYDFVELEGDKIGIVIGDVSGKGVPAALYMARTISEFRTASRMHRDAASTLKYINEVFVKEGMEKAFITIQYLIADLKSKRLICSNGGHNTILHFVKKENKVEEIDTEGGMAIGVIEDVEFDNKEIHFDKRDILLLYTDGISEAMDRRHREFGLDKVKAILIDNSQLSAEEIMSRLYEEIAKFSKGTPQYDDMTVVVIKAV